MIRTAVKEDAQQIHDIEFGSIVCPWSLTDIEEALENPAYIYLVSVGQFAVVGYASVRIAGSEAEIGNIAVVPYFRRRGIAKELLSALIDQAAAKGAESFFLEVDPDNTAALLLYQQFGFIKISVRKNYYKEGSDAMVLKLEL